MSSNRTMMLKLEREGLPKGRPDSLTPYSPGGRTLANPNWPDVKHPKRGFAIKAIQAERERKRAKGRAAKKKSA